MASDSDSILSTPKIKQEAPELQPIAAGRKKAAKKDPDRPKKRNLVRWDDDLDKQVLLTLQWACNEVGVKIPWELVAKTIGNGISEGAIVQHLSKLRGKMAKADIPVPPTLRRGTVAKEPSKIYANSNGKKLPPPIFAAPTTPVRVKSKKQATPKIQSTPKTKARSNGKRRRSNLEDSDEEAFDDYIADSDEEYGTAKKKLHSSKPKARESKATISKSVTKNANAPKVELNAAATEEINQDIMRTFEDGGPASRTRHVKQDFSNLEPNLTDEEEVEEEGEEGEEDEVDEEDEAIADFEMPTAYSPAKIEGEGCISPRTVIPTNKINVAEWSQGVTPKMLPISSSAGSKGSDIVPAYQHAILSGGNGLITPQSSRNPSTTSFNASLLNTPVPLNFGRNEGQNLDHNGYGPRAQGAHDHFAPINYNSVSSHLPTLNDDVDDLGMGFGNDDFDMNAPLPPTGLNSTFEDMYQLDESFLGEFDF